MKIVSPPLDNPALDVSSLIDMVFLLLVFFMATASLVKSEGDLGIKLPGIVQTSVPVDMTDEQIVEVRPGGEVYLNGREYGRADEQALPELVVTLERYRLASEAAKNKALLTIWAADESEHQRVIDVLDACAAAGIENVTFTSSIE